MESENVDLIRQFCAAWSRHDIDELLGYLAEDAIYHNMPMQPVVGHDAIRSIFGVFLTPSQAVDWEVLEVAASGDTVFAERVDRYEMGERKVELPVVGVFEIRDGKIAAWRDYFDMTSWTRQTQPS